MAQKHIIAGSGGFNYDGHTLTVGPILKYAFNVAGKDRPKICLIATARGDAASYVTNFYDACSAENVDASHLELFPTTNHDDIESFVLSQDIIWVAGGSVVNLLAVWRAHGLDVIFKKAWEQGIVLTGQSAGAICWNVGGTTDSFGVTNMQPVINGLAFLPYSCGVHYDTEDQRRPMLQRLVSEGALPNGYATDDGVNIHFIDQKFHKAVSDKPGVHAYKVTRSADGTINEEVLVPELILA